MINTIVLDIGQVLANFRWKEYLIECGYDQETIQKVSNATVLNRLWGEEDRGKISTKELVELCCAEDPSVADEIRKLFSDITKMVREYDYSADFIKHLKAAGYKVYLLSNYGETNFQYAKEHFNFLKYVDGGVISYEVKHIKPEQEIYECLINKYNINPKEAVFLDDSQANLEGARKFGFATIHVQEFSKALHELKALGVKIDYTI
jgi:putative hydrolase of the HAD superfamily